MSKLVRAAGAIGTRIVHIRAPVARAPWPLGPSTARSNRNAPSRYPRPQARPQEDAARGSAADEASGDPRGPPEEAAPRAPPASDLGTTVTNTLDKNLGVKTFFNGTVNSASIVEIHGKQDQGDAAEGRDVGEGGSRDPAARSFRRGGQGADPQRQEARLCHARPDQRVAVLGGGQVRADRRHPGDIQRDGCQRGRDRGSPARR